MSKIKILSKQLADKIAAGEVVERPASVVKELVENSLDARSNNLEVIIEDAGLKSIKVIDDGQGIETDDLPQACLRHATSKINSDADLTNIMTLGFRGEALASIAAVSRLTLCSATASTQIARQLYSEGGETKNICETVRTKGTTVEVLNLFYNTPARLKFLKTKTTEMANITRIITELALAYPQIGFKLIHNQKALINCSAHPSLLQRIEVLLGKEFAQELVPISLNIAMLKISGFVSKAGCGYSSRKQQYLFVNNRSIADKTMSHAIVQGYNTFLMEKKFPAALIFIQTPAQMIDVNVHPSKREIRFQQAGMVHDLLVKAIKDALTDKDHLPQMPNNQLPRFGKQDGSIFFFSNNKRKTDGINYIQQAYVQRQQSEEKLFSIADAAQTLFNQENEQVYAQGKRGDYLQVHSTYIVTQDDKGLIVIDQHAAHERIIFDQLFKQFKQKKVEKQKLLLPITLHLNAQEFILINEHKTAFEQLGFEIEDFGDNSLAVYAYPAILGKIDIKAEFQAIANDIIEFEISPDFDAKINQFLAPIACHSAVRANQELSSEKIACLLQSLWQTEAPYTCPHGRPTVITISWSDLEKRFQRK
ncbi:MAG: DNA mismatch repair endonuclease MutL [Candidatus Omnitrophica bacterium]|nr:DNA mismatch repair endonuclease MutL [Candidatus Omnitrophota bacterium]